MKKSDAIKMFGNAPGVARALGISKQAVYKWPEDLPDTMAGRVIMAAVRRGTARVEFTEPKAK